MLPARPIPAHSWIIRVDRTIADIAVDIRIATSHLAEAIRCESLNGQL